MVEQFPVEPVLEFGILMCGLPPMICSASGFGLGIRGLPLSLAFPPPDLVF